MIRIFAQLVSLPGLNTLLHRKCKSYEVSTKFNTDNQPWNRSTENCAMSVASINLLHGNVGCRVTRLPVNMERRALILNSSRLLFQLLS